MFQYYTSKSSFVVDVNQMMTLLLQEFDGNYKSFPQRKQKLTEVLKSCEIYITTNVNII